MRQLFKSLEHLQIICYPLDILEHKVELRIYSSNHAVYANEIENMVDYESLIHERLKETIIHNLYGGIMPIISQLSMIAKTSNYANIQEILDLVEQANEICNGN